MGTYCLVNHPFGGYCKGEPKVKRVEEEWQVSTGTTTKQKITCKLNPETCGFHEVK